MKSTKKRFNEGGTSEDKEAGLKASKGEDVGFFERLRMGNIDDPKSEAFKRLGAGRGATERGRSVPIEDRIPTPVTRMPEANVEMPAPPRRVVPQMMAAEQEGGRLSPAESIAEESGRLRIPPTEAFARKAAPAPVARVQTKAKPSVAEFQAAIPKRSAMGSMQGMPEPEAKKPKDELADDYREALMERIRKSKSRKPEGTATNYRSVTERLKEQFGFKNGGSVSASRGDGIAQRGKTRGKYC